MKRSNVTRDTRRWVDKISETGSENTIDKPDSSNQDSTRKALG